MLHTSMNNERIIFETNFKILPLNVQPFRLKLLHQKQKCNLDGASINNVLKLMFQLWKTEKNKKNNDSIAFFIEHFDSQNPSH